MKIYLASYAYGIGEDTIEHFFYDISMKKYFKYTKTITMYSVYLYDNNDISEYEYSTTFLPFIENVIYLRKIDINVLDNLVMTHILNSIL